ncbi:MAG TPA: hypothetical protein VK176_07030, partial [Phycisphaerales bacterium]|nr:hypothetical protein [Phycisphaerales bacterium]
MFAIDGLLQTVDARTEPGDMFERSLYTAELEALIEHVIDPESWRWNGVAPGRSRARILAWGGALVVVQREKFFDQIEAILHAVHGVERSATAVEVDEKTHIVPVLDIVRRFRKTSGDSLHSGVSEIVRQWSTLIDPELWRENGGDEIEAYYLNSAVYIRAPKTSYEHMLDHLEHLRRADGSTRAVEEGLACAVIDVSRLQAIGVRAHPYAQAGSFSRSIGGLPFDVSREVNEVVHAVARHFAAPGRPFVSSMHTFPFGDRHVIVDTPQVLERVREILNLVQQENPGSEPAAADVHGDFLACYDILGLILREHGGSSLTPEEVNRIYVQIVTRLGLSADTVWPMRSVCWAGEDSLQFFGRILVRASPHVHTQIASEMRRFAE